MVSFLSNLGEYGWNVVRTMLCVVQANTPDNRYIRFSQWPKYSLDICNVIRDSSLPGCIVNIITLDDIGLQLISLGYVAKVEIGGGKNGLAAENLVISRHEPN